LRFFDPSPLTVCINCSFFTARRSYARAVLGVVILSACPFVCLSHACFATTD